LAHRDSEERKEMGRRKKFEREEEEVEYNIAIPKLKPFFK